MASAQTEALECDSYATAGQTKHEDTSLVSTETEAFECNQYVGPVDTVRGMHSGIIVDSTGVELLESAGGSEKAVPGDTEAAHSSDHIAPGDNDDSRGGGSVPVNTVIVLEQREVFQFDCCAVDSDNPVDMQAAANEQDGAMMASARAESFDNATNADDSRVFRSDQGLPTSSPTVPKTEEEATISSLEDNKGHFTAHVNREVTKTATMVSNHEESFGVAATEKSEGGKFVDGSFHDLEENQVAEHAYDMEFDIDAHDMPLEESFFDGNCIFPALDADKTEAWHAGVDDVIMEETSAQLHSNLHPQDVDTKSLSEETNIEPVTMHEVKENAASNEEWLHNTRQQPGCNESVLVDALHRVEEASDPSNMHLQGHEELAGYPCNGTDRETLASVVVQDKDLAWNYSKDEDTQENQVQYDTDDIFASLAGENVETVHDAGTCEAKRLEAEVKTNIIVKENEFEPTSINVTHEDAAVHLHELDHDMPGGPPVFNSATTNLNPVSKDVKLHLKARDLLEDSRLDSCIGQKETVTQVECQGKGTSQGSVGSDFVKKDEDSDMKSNEAIAGDQLVAKNNTLPLDSLVGLCTNSPAFILSGNTEPEHVPTSSEQGESTSVIVCRDVSMDSVSEPLAEEEASTLEQNTMHEELAVNNIESQYSHCALSQVERVQNQNDEPVVMDGSPVNGFDGGVLVVRNNDVKEICESGNETVELGKVAEPEARASNKEREQNDQNFVDDFDGNLPESNKSELKEIHASGKFDGNLPEPNKSELKEIHASGKFDGNLPEPNKSELKEIHASGDEIQEGIVEKKPKIEELKESDGESVDIFDGSVAEMRKSDVDEIFHSGDGIMEGEVVVPEQEIVAPYKEPEDHSSMPLAGASSPRSDSAEESKKQELSAEALIHPPSPSDPETNVSSGTYLTEKGRVSDGPKDSEKSAPVEQSEAPLVSAAVSKKQSKKVISDDKLSKAELSNKFKLSTVKEAKEADYVGNYVNAKCRSEREEESSVKKVQKPVKQGFAFGIGDLVWAKVRSHPWWPAQIFDPADASKSARKAKKSGRVLVAFFGDCTFAWLQQSQMIAFCPNFKEKVQQTTMRIFCLAVEEALEELCRRSELGLSCKHFKGSLHSTSSFPDANTGIREGVRVERFKDIHTSAEIFRPKKTLEFVKNVAASPLGAWSSTLQWAESRGHAYGLRTCMVAMQGLDLASVFLTHPAVPTQGLKLKRSHSSLNAEDIPDAGHGGKESKKSKRLKSDKDRKDSGGKGLLGKAVSGEENKQVSSCNEVQLKSGMKDLTDTRERNKDRNIIKIKLRKTIKSDHLSSSERHLDTPSGEEAGGERNLNDSKETLLAIAGHSVKVLKRSSLKEEKISSTSKKVRRQIGEDSQNDTSMHQAVKVSLSEGFSDMDADNSLGTGTDTADTFNVLPLPSRDGVKKTEGAKMSVEIGLKKEASVKDNSAGNNEFVRKFSKVGDSIKRVASELKGAPVAKVVDDARHAEAEVKKDMKESPLEHQASPMRSKISSKESSEDVSLLQLRRDLELLAKKAGSGGAKGKAVKQSKKRDRAEAVAAKSSPRWQSVPQRSQRSCVQELALAARKRKSEIVHDEVILKLPKNSSTTGSQRHHASKGYITSAEKPGERRSYDKSLLLYSRRPAPPASSMKSSSQRYDEKLSSHAPLGLFMRFPEDFPLPSEAQLKATFIPFGPLQMSATRLYKDSASAQVVFKHGRDAESALKHAKKNPMFGQVAVTYRLRHLSHSTRVETKTDPPSSNKAHSSHTAALRESAPSREKLGGASASLEKRAGDKEVVSSTMLTSSNHDNQSGSEPTGDIQDQMMTLLRQVSVIVNTSPVTSDGGT